MRFVDWFCGIGGFRLGLEQAGGFEHAASCEIESFPRAVYAARFGAAPTFEDVTHVQASEIPKADLWCAGFPCQDVSQAGAGKGLLGGARSSLVFRLLGLCAVARPRWVLLENVPGLLVSGRGFDRLLGVLSRLGYGWAYRRLDAQYFGLAQRRKRILLLACLDPAAGMRRAAQVLLEPEGMRGGPAPRREEGARVAHALVTRPGQRGEANDTWIWAEGVADPLTANEGSTYTHEGRGNFRMRNVVAYAIPSSGATVAVGGCYVRRLTPLECERLQGFPDGFTDIPGASDARRYRALGNAVAVPVVRWVGERLRRFA